MGGLLCSCISIELFLKVYDREDAGLWETWGQTAQLIATVWAMSRWIQAISRMFTVKAAKRRRAVLKRCAIGTGIPEIGNIKKLDPNGQVFWRYVILRVRRAYQNHPFGDRPPRRSCDHARFCDPDVGWKGITLDYRQWPNETEEWKGEQLLEGAKKGDLIYASNLLEEEAPINFRDDHGHTALRVAVDFDQINIVSKLLERGAGPDIPDSANKTSLHVCSEFGKDDIIPMLARKGAEIEAVDNVKGWTPLLWAAYYAKPSTVAELLKIRVNERRVNVNARDAVKGRTALHLAVRIGSDGTADVLARSADPNSTDPNIIDLNSTDKKGKTLLYITARYEREEGARLLLNNGADPNIADTARNWTPLHVCARYGRTKIAELLLENHKHCCDANLLDKDEGRTALHIAVQYGREKIVDLLFKFGADLNITDNKGRTALYYAAKDNRDCTRKLLKQGADVKKGDTSMLRHLLLTYGVNENEAHEMITQGRNEDIRAAISGKKPE